MVSRRSTKKPWVDVEPIDRNVERAFVFPVHLGETTLPFRTLEPVNAVLPIERDRLLSASSIGSHADLDDWWGEAETKWGQSKKTGDESSLLQRIDFHGQLSAQLPSGSQRVVYTKAGAALTAARIQDPRVIIDHKLYWAAAHSADEALFLVGILNSEAVLERARPFQAVGLFGPRDFDKNVFFAPIPTFDAAESKHHALVAVARRAEEFAKSAQLDSTRDFKFLRKSLRAELETAGILPDLNSLAAEIIPAVRVADDGITLSGRKTE